MRERMKLQRSGRWPGAHCIRSLKVQPVSRLGLGTLGLSGLRYSGETYRGLGEHHGVPEGEMRVPATDSYFLPRRCPPTTASRIVEKRYSFSSLRPPYNSGP